MKLEEFENIKESLFKDSILKLTKDCKNERIIHEFVFYGGKVLRHSKWYIKHFVWANEEKEKFKRMSDCFDEDGPYTAEKVYEKVIEPLAEKGYEVLDWRKED